MARVVEDANGQTGAESTPAPSTPCVPDHDASTHTRRREASRERRIVCRRHCRSARSQPAVRPAWTPGAGGAGRRPALVRPFGVRANAGDGFAFALTLRASEDDP